MIIRVNWSKEMSMPPLGPRYTPNKNRKVVKITGQHAFDYESQKTYDLGVDIRSVASFILWHNNNIKVGGVVAKDAFEAYARVIGIPSHVLLAICSKGKVENVG